MNCQEEYPGNFGVALVIHFIRENNGEGGVSLGELPHLLEEISNSFEPHGIFFKLKCVTEISNSALLSSTNASVLDLAAVYEDETAINLFITVPARGGLATVGGRLAVSGYSSISNEYTVIHELGHTLGLFHTFAGTPHGTDQPGGAGSNNPAEFVDGTDCCIRGDHVCDTPADPNISAVHSNYGGTGVQFDCSWINPPVVDPNGDVYLNPLVNGRSNFMSYYGGTFCDDHFFTEGQANRMRAFLTERSALQPVRRDEFVISEEVIWDEDKIADVDVTILPGGRLRINDATLSMSPGKRILVENQGILNVRNSTITVGTPYANDCISGSFWKGIEVAGATTFSDFGGIAIIYNSTVEFAENAVYLANPFQFGGPHGRLYTAHSTYRNNRVALNLFMDNPNIQDNLYNYRAIRCDFIIDEDFPTNNSFIYHVSLVNIAHVLFDGCTFATPNLEEYVNTQGIFSFRSSPTVKSYCGLGYPNAPCPEIAYESSSFSGFENGILLLESDGANVQEVSFDNCLRGIYADGSNNLAMRDNIFTVADYNDIQRSGISLNECTGYTIDGNQFFVDNPNDLNLQSSGLYIFRSGEEYNEVTNNSFTGLRRGIYVSGRNRNVSIPTVGLGLFCNIHDNAEAGFQSASGPFDVYTDFGTTMAGLQGSAVRPAGNLFSNNTVTNGADFYYFNLGSQLNYWYKEDGAPAEFPDNVFQVQRSGSDENSRCGDYATASPTNPNEVDVLYDTYLDFVGLWHSSMDGGDKEGLLTQIATTPLHQFQAVKTTLADISPFLSVEVMMAAFNRTGAFQDSELQWLITENPELIKESQIKELIKNRWGSNTLAALETSIAQNTNSPSERAVLESQIYEEARTVMPLINRGIQQMYEDSTLVDYAPLRDALAPKATLAAALQSAETFWREGNLAKYDQAANDLIIEFSGEQDIADYAAFTGALLAQYQAGKLLKNMSAIQIQNLVDLGANCTNSLIRQRIGHFLYAYFQIELPAAGPSAQPVSTGETGTSLAPYNSTKEVSAPVWALEVYPNPVLGNGVITVVTPHAGEWEYVLMDVNQQIQAKGKWATANSNSHTLDVRKYSKGIYFLQLQSTTTTAQAKLIIQ